MQGRFVGFLAGNNTQWGTVSGSKDGTHTLPIAYASTGYLVFLTLRVETTNDQVSVIPITNTTFRYRSLAIDDVPWPSQFFTIGY